MTPESPLPAVPCAAVVVAAGTGSRASGSRPKQFLPVGGIPMLRRAVLALRAHPAVGALVVVGHPDHLDATADTVRGLDATVVSGGAHRRESVRAGLEALADAAPDHVLIHDAARPNCPVGVIDRLLAALADAPGAIPVLAVTDSIARAEGGAMAGPVDRDGIVRVQTPQAFRYAAILAAHRDWRGMDEPTDDAQLLHAAGGRVKLVEGDPALMKYTVAADFAGAAGVAAPPRIGCGYDVHRLGEGHELWLGGVRIDHPRGLVGHSDADVLLHALTDAVLGAIGAGDIGTHFPPSDERWRGAASPRFLAHALTLARDAGYRLGNADCTLICEEPRIGPHRAAIRARIAEICEVAAEAISIKATTTEGLGFTGRREAIAAEAVAILLPR